MKRLILARHAKSSWDSPSQEDFDRPLNARGLRDVPLAAERLAQFVGDEKIIMECSPAERAKTTALALAVQLPAVEMTWNDSIYLCAPETWLKLIRQWDDAFQTGMTVGHNPGATSMVNQLSQSRIDNMPTCSIAALEFEVTSWQEVDWGLGKLVWFDYPKLHGN